MWRDGSPQLWGTERLSRVLVRVMQAGTGVRIGVAQYRQVAIEMGRRIRGLAVKQVEMRVHEGDDGDGDDVDPVTGEPVGGGSWNIVWDLQATHGTRVARQHYAVSIGYPGRLQPEMIATFREVSRLWHQFLEHGNEGGDPNSHGKRKHVGQPAEGAKRARTAGIDGRTSQTSIEADMAAGLRKLLGPEATWRSDKQAECMRVIMGLSDGQSAINVLPTGAGKSILFMLPAVMPDGGTSIVVVPFIALIDDLVMRARAMGVDCIRFMPSLSVGRDGMARAARLVVVSADVAAGAEFSTYADGLLSTGLLQRIFIDECHTAITDHQLPGAVGRAQETAPVRVPAGAAHGHAASRARELVPAGDASAVGRHSARPHGQAELPVPSRAGQAGPWRHSEPRGRDSAAA